MAARARIESAGIGEGACARIKAVANVPPARGINEGYRDGRRNLTAPKKYRMHCSDPQNTLLARGVATGEGHRGQSRRRVA
jgi:hypothetical protein